jgi:hypothetical protein
MKRNKIDVRTRKELRVYNYIHTLVLTERPVHKGIPEPNYLGWHGWALHAIKKA